jgi:hypothetical protein
MNSKCTFTDCVLFVAQGTRGRFTAQGPNQEDARGVFYGFFRRETRTERREEQRGTKIQHFSFSFCLKKYDSTNVRLERDWIA